MRQTFRLDNLRHIARSAADGGDTGADTVCFMANDLARAQLIEQAAGALLVDMTNSPVGGHGPEPTKYPLLAALREALESKAPCLEEEGRADED